MFNNFENYYHENVITPYYEYMEQKGNSIYGRSRDIRLAISCATNLFHLREHIPGELPISRSEIETLCPAYSILGDVVNVSKHKKIYRNSPCITCATQIQEVLVSTMFTDDVGDYTYKDKIINIQLNNGEYVQLHELLYEVIVFWDKYLFEHNIIKKRRSFTKPNDNIHRDRDECSNLDIEIVSGLPFQMCCQVKKYNYEQKKIGPVDLTDAKIEWNVFKPVDIDFTVTSKKSNKSLIKTVTLNLEDTKTFNSLDSEEEKAKFVQNLEYVQEVLISAVKELD